MDSLLKHLALAERLVFEGEQRLVRQRATLERLRRDGHATRSAQTLLERMEESQALYREDLHRLRGRLRGSHKAPHSLP